MDELRSAFDFSPSDDETRPLRVRYKGLPCLGGTLAQVRDAVATREADARWPLIAASLVLRASEALVAEGAQRSERIRITPQTLFFTFDGSVALRTADAPRPERSALAYAAPELVRDEHALDERTGVWALGVTMWELLVRRSLFERASPRETTARVLAGPIPYPSEIVAGLPVALDEVVMKALERDPARRQQTMHAFGRDLARFCRLHEGAFGPKAIGAWLAELLGEH